MTALPPGWMSVSQAAVYFGIGRTTAYKLVAAGEWPTSRLPGMRDYRLSPQDIADIEDRAQCPAESADLGATG